MREILYILTFTFSLTACNQNSTTTSKQNTDTLDKSILVDTIKKSEQNQISKRLSFKHVNEIFADSSYSVWVKLNGETASLALHFINKDTLDVSYSPECWLTFPYKVEGNKIVVFWDNNIDTKYNFDIVKAINKIDKKVIGKPFMILELENDTTLKATYPMKYLINRINNSSKERTFFPDKYVIAQEGYL